MTGSNTELAKNLILAGANITIVDSQLIGERDTDTNFIFTKQQLGLKRGEEAQKELKLINPLVRIEWLEQFPSEEQLGIYNALVSSRTNFKEMIELDNLSQKLNIPYYNLVCCGYYGFMYIGLGTKFIYEREKKMVIQIVFGKKQEEKDQYREFEQVVAKSVPLVDSLDEKFTPKGQITNLVYYCILMMKKAQESLNYDPYNPDEELLEQHAKLGAEIYKNATGKDATDEQISTFRNFAKFYGVDYCPVYSVIGSVASQELIISTSRINEPGINWFCYDSEASYGQVEVTQDIQFPTTDLPERRQLITKD